MHSTNPRGPVAVVGAATRAPAVRPPAFAREHRFAVSPAAIRGRIAKVVAAYREPSAAFPDPIPADEAGAVLALTDDEINDLQAVLVFARRWGVCLNWLLLGDERSLILNLRESMERDDAAPELLHGDPVVHLYNAWRRDWWSEIQCLITHGDMRTGEPGEQEAGEVARKASERARRSAAHLGCSVARTLEGVRLQLLALAETCWDLRLNGDPESITEGYEAYEHHVGQGDDRARLILSLYAAVARMLGRDDADEAAAAASRVR
ncbi:MAG: hypothetical protein AAGF76_16765, partial [Pseudomonadota bacterium]